MPRIQTALPMAHPTRYFNAITLVTFFACSFLLWQCKEIDKLLTFRFTNGSDFTVPSGAVLNTPYSIPTPNVTTNSSQSLKNNNTDINKVKNIRLESLTLTVTSPSTGNFQSLQSIKIYITASGQDEKLIAYKNDIPVDAGNTLSLDTTQEALDAYVKQEQYTLRTEVVSRQAVLYDRNIHASMVFKVTANL